MLAVLDRGLGDVVLSIFDSWAIRAPPEGRAGRLAPRRRGSAQRPLQAALQPDLLFAGSARPATSPSRALALAVSRSPGLEPPSRLEGIYSRPSAAEEKHGAP